jgi:hypothetical protein
LAGPPGVGASRGASFEDQPSRRQCDAVKTVGQCLVEVHVPPLQELSRGQRLPIESPFIWYPSVLAVPVPALLLRYPLAKSIRLIPRLITNR